MNNKQLSVLGLSSALLLGTLGVVGFNSSTVLAQSSVSTPVVAQAGTVISTGSFTTVDRGHATSGSVRIVSENGQRYIEFGQDFATGSGPDVKVILSRDEVVTKKLTEGSYITLARLESFNGSQRYAIPEDVNLDEYNSVAVWCKQFNVTFGYAAL